MTVRALAMNPKKGGDDGSLTAAGAAVVECVAQSVFSTSVHRDVGALWDHKHDA